MQPIWIFFSLLKHIIIIYSFLEFTYFFKKSIFENVGAIKRGAIQTLLYASKKTRKTITTQTVLAKSDFHYFYVVLSDCGTYRLLNVLMLVFRSCTLWPNYMPEVY